jgi:hypothetical protein
MNLPRIARGTLEKTCGGDILCSWIHIVNMGDDGSGCEIETLTESHYTSHR